MPWVSGSLFGRGPGYVSLQVVPWFLSQWYSELRFRSTPMPVPEQPFT
jgi:hypothetical protein